MSDVIGIKNDENILKEICRVIEAKYPKVEIDMRIEDDAIYGTVYANDSRTFDSAVSRRGLVSLVKRSVDLGDLILMGFGFSLSRKNYKEGLVLNYLQSKLKYVSRMYYADIKVRIDRDSVAISIVCRDHLEKLQATVFELRDEIKMLSGCKRLSISASNGLPQECPVYASCADDDDDLGNPNWPSKTGKPSGGGRGNNPPK